jgi:hypothetical protein
MDRHRASSSAAAADIEREMRQREDEYPDEE